jgi:6-phosphofructokinase 1
MNTPTILIGQSGGPTAVINASLYGLIKEAKLKCPLHHIIGCHHGIDGILYEEFISLDEVKATLSTTPVWHLDRCEKSYHPTKRILLFMSLYERYSKNIILPISFNWWE